MDWNLDQIDTFIAAAEAGSFSAAARRLGKAQSAVSTAIALLEASLGLTLFDRSARMPVLTEAGHTLLAEARELSRQCRYFENRALAMNSQAPGRFSIALDEGLPYPPALAMLQALAEPFPQLELTVCMGSPSDVRGWLLAGQADVGLAFRRGAEDAALESEPVGAVPRVVVAGASHELAQTPHIDRRALARHRQLLLTPRFTQDEADEQISPQLWRADSLYTVAELAALGLGWAVLPLNIARFPTLDARLVQLQVTDLAFPALEARLHWRAGQGTAPVLAWLRRYLANAIFARE